MADAHPVTAWHVFEGLLAILLTVTVCGVLLFLSPLVEQQVLVRQLPVPGLTSWVFMAARFLGNHWMHVLLPLILLLAECFAHGAVGTVVRRVTIVAAAGALLLVAAGLILPGV